MWFGLAWVLFSWLALARYHTFHNVTFDLAFYTRMAWGHARLDFWDPILNAHVLGLHLSPVLFPLGWIGAVTGGLPELLLIAQAGCFAATVFPLARIGARHLGRAGFLLAPALFLLHPTVSHVASYEFHPGSLAVLPLAFLLDALDTGARKQFVWSALAMVCCREDLTLITTLAACMFFVRAGGGAEPQLRKKSAAMIGVASLLWFGVFTFVLHPWFAPADGSLSLHFGRWGGSPMGVLVGVFKQPGELVTTLLRPRNMQYLAALFAPLCFLPFLAPRYLVLVAPTLAINLVSDWPTTTDLSAHYSSMLVPVLVVSTVAAAGSLRRRLRPRWVTLGLFVTAIAHHAIAGQTPLSTVFDWAAFREDDRARAGAEIVEQIGDDETVQAPYALLSHLAAREFTAPSPPPDRNHGVVVLDAAHRNRFAGSGSLLRTAEEPVVRDWLAKDDFQLQAIEGPYLLLRRGSPARQSRFFDHYFRNDGDNAVALAAGPAVLTACLQWVGAEVRPSPSAGRSRPQLWLAFDAKGPCPADLALRIGKGFRPRRTDLLFDGLMNPVHLRNGDRVWSMHDLSHAEQRWFQEGRLRVGLLRQSGSRPAGPDPVSLPLRLTASKR